MSGGTDMGDSATSQQNVSFPSNGNEAHGYLALPPGGSGPGLIVIQEWWGLTDQIASTTDRFAAEGFVALAPDLYGGRTTHDAGEAQAMMESLPAERAARDLTGAVDYLLGRPDVTGESVGAVGFCMGGGFVLTLAQIEGDRIAAAVPFYGVMSEIPDDMSNLTAPIQGHYGEQDAFIPVSAVTSMADKIRSDAGSTPDIHFYPAGHAFMNEENLLGTFDSVQAELAWGRAVSFLRSRLA